MNSYSEIRQRNRIMRIVSLPALLLPRGVRRYCVKPLALIVLAIWIPPALGGAFVNLIFREDV